VIKSFIIECGAIFWQDSKTNVEDSSTNPVFLTMFPLHDFQRFKQAPGYVCHEAGIPEADQVHSIRDIGHSVGFIQVKRPIVFPAQGSRFAPLLSLLSTIISLYRAIWQETLKGWPPISINHTAPRRTDKHTEIAGSQKMAPDGDRLKEIDKGGDLNFSIGKA